MLNWLTDLFKKKTVMVKIPPAKPRQAKAKPVPVKSRRKSRPLVFLPPEIKARILKLQKDFPELMASEIAQILKIERRQVYAFWEKNQPHRKFQSRKHIALKPRVKSRDPNILALWALIRQHEERHPEKTPQEIAEALNIPLKAIYYYYRFNPRKAADGRQNNGGHGIAPSPEKIQKMQAMRDNGKNITEVCAEFGISRKTVLRYTTQTTSTTYTRMDNEERERIQFLFNQGLTTNEIALRTGRSYSIIERELDKLTANPMKSPSNGKREVAFTMEPFENKFVVLKRGKPHRYFLTQGNALTYVDKKNSDYYKTVDHS